jgi:hypothetical protein
MRRRKKSLIVWLVHPLDLCVMRLRGASPAKRGLHWTLTLIFLMPV